MRISRPGRYARVMGFALLVIGLAVVVIAIGAGMVWQERADLPDTEIVYGVEDSIEFVSEGLDPATRDRIGRNGIRRMLEWEVRWLQLGDDERGGPAIAGSEEAAAYIQERCWEQGHAYEPEDIFAVLDLEAAYLLALGALGEAVAPDEVVADESGTDDHRGR